MWNCCVLCQPLQILVPTLASVSQLLPSSAGFGSLQVACIVHSVVTRGHKRSQALMTLSDSTVCSYRAKKMEILNNKSRITEVSLKRIEFQMLDDGQLARNLLC